jgi:hypothetical protein
MEHCVYLCSWTKTPRGYSLWVKSRAKACAEAASVEDAVELLMVAIDSIGGAMHAVLEFDPPLPLSVSDAKYVSPEIYLIGGDDRFETSAPKSHPFESESETDERLQWVDCYFQSPVCRECKYASSPLNDRPLTLTYAPSRYDGAFGCIGHDGSTTIQVFSEEFLRLLSPEEMRHLEFRPVNRKSRSRKFFELLGPAGPPFVAVSGIKISGWRCPRCGHCTWGYWVDGMTITHFIAKSDLPTSLEGVFAVGVPPEVHVAVTADRWKELVDRKGTRGFVSQLLGVLPEHEVVRHPESPLLSGNER